MQYEILIKIYYNGKEKTTKKNLLKKEPKAPKNMTYEEKVALKTSGVPGKTKTVEHPKEEKPDSHVQYITALPETPFNSRDLNRKLTKRNKY